MSFLFPSTRLLAGLLASACAALAACSGDDRGAPPPSTLARAVQRGAIRIGYANEAPFAYMESHGGLTGEAPAIARVVLGRLGVPRVEGVLTEFGALIPGLLAGRFDIIAAGMYVLPERCRQVAFSRPTYGVGEAFLERADDPRRLRGYRQVAADPSVRLGVVAGAVQVDYARRAGIPDSRVVVFPDVVSAVEGVQAGRADAYAATSLTVNHVLTKVPDWNIRKVRGFRQPVLDGETVRGYGAFAFRKQDQDLRRAFDGELARFIGSDEHERLVAPFGFTRNELPGDMTAARLCGDQAGEDGRGEPQVSGAADAPAARAAAPVATMHTAAPEDAARGRDG
ncbi:ectoine/hydroxyectoine ABC transporter substrate-binding protein EhuB [Pigmentiphaga soli]|uniref:Ectoine/hydroxyectoine ABC transporter substrate-binding protein EhuB n=1 Tax=Pigmentiphaga soli TaxID=1007095 RepID=A0ABP8HHT5_9BURK